MHSSAGRWYSMYSTMRDALKGVWVEPNFESFGGNGDYYKSLKDKATPEYSDGENFFHKRVTSELVNRNVYQTENEKEAQRFIDILTEEHSAYVVGKTYQKTDIVVGSDVRTTYQITTLSNSVGVALADKLMNESSIELISAGHSKPNERVQRYLNAAYI